MEVYYFTIFIISMFALFEVTHIENKNMDAVKKWMTVTIYVILVMQMGLRWETGTDWDPYIDMFQRLRNEFTWGTESTYHFESGYTLFTQVIYKIWPNYSAFLFIHAAIFYFLIFKSFKFFTPYFFSAILIFYSITLGMWGSSRSLLAVAIGLYSLVFLVKKNYKIYFLLIAIAFFFHTTSLLYLTYFFLNRRLKHWQIALLVVVGFVIGLTSIPTQLFVLSGSFNDVASDKTTQYLDAQKDGGSAISIVGLLKRVMIAAVFIFFRDRISKKLPTFNLILNGYIFCVVFYLLFYKSVAVMIGRGIMYYNIMEPLLLSCLFFVFKDVLARHLVIIAITLLSIFNLKQSIASYPDLFDPYKGIFYNENYRRLMH